MTNLPYSQIVCDIKHLIRIIMPNGDNIGVKSILVMSPTYMTSQSGALCISVTYYFLGRQDLFGSWISYQNLRKMLLMGLSSLVGYLVHLRHSWQNGENDKGPSMGSRIKRFDYRKFPLSGKWYCTQFCKITTGHGNTIEDLANMMERNFISRHAKTWSVLVAKEIVQWPSGTVLPGFHRMLTLSVWIWYFVTEVHCAKFHHQIYGSF